MSNSRTVIVITGASQGLGAGMVKAFRELDYQVVATSRSIKPSTDPDIHTVAGDIGDPAVAQRHLVPASLAHDQQRQHQQQDQVQPDP